MTEQKTITQEIEELIERVQENHGIVITDINANVTEIGGPICGQVDYIINNVSFSALTTSRMGNKND